MLEIDIELVYLLTIRTSDGDKELSGFVRSACGSCFRGNCHCFMCTNIGT
jgi:hypothetical protein